MNFERSDRMKTKYDQLTREDKKNLQIKYKKTEAGSLMLERLVRLQIIGIAGLLLAVGLFLFQFKTLKITDYLIIIPLFLASILFLMMSFKLKKKVLNQFLLKRK